MTRSGPIHNLALVGFMGSGKTTVGRYVARTLHFRFVDTDNSGTLDRKEIRRAMDMWNIPIDDEKLDDLIAACDPDGDGQINP